MPWKWDAVGVGKTTQALLECKKLKIEPAWLSAVANHPPNVDLVRHTVPTLSERAGKRPDLRRPQLIVYSMDDRLRTKFYREHPWELARPMVVMEEDGADYAKEDWSKMSQPYKKLDGESVVRRALWIFKHQRDGSWESAMDTASKRRGIPLNGHPSSVAATPLTALQRMQRTQDIANQEHAEKLKKLGDEYHTLRIEESNAAREIAEAKLFLDEITRLKLDFDNSSDSSKAQPHHEEKKKELYNAFNDMQDSYVRAVLRYHQLQQDSARVIEHQKQARKAIRKPFTEALAYQKACLEFYALRQREEFRDRIQLEEATQYHANAGVRMHKTSMERQVETEQKYISNWKRKAQRHLELVINAGMAGRGRKRVEATEDSYESDGDGRDDFALEGPRDFRQG